MNRYGYIKDRTRSDANEIIQSGDLCTILMYKSDGTEQARACFDLRDLETVRGYKWHLAGNGYPSAHVGPSRITMPMHRLFLGQAIGLEIDHLNRNKLDNTRSNLAFVTHRDNILNSNAGRPKIRRDTEEA